MVECQHLLYGRVKILDLGKAWHGQPMVGLRIGEGLVIGAVSHRRGPPILAMGQLDSQRRS